jgi:hypothetical protein
MARYAERLIQIRDGKIISDDTGAEAQDALANHREHTAA